MPCCKKGSENTLSRLDERKSVSLPVSLPFFQHMKVYPLILFFFFRSLRGTFYLLQTFIIYIILNRYNNRASENRYMTPL